MKILNSDDFVKSVEKGLSVVDFYATWCKPCLSFAPIFEQLENDFKDKANFFKVDIDQAESVARDYKILSIPTLLIFKDGKEIVRNIGAMDAIKFRMWLNENL